MKVLVCGSVKWRDHRAIARRLALLPRGAVVIHGAARGADSLAASVCHALGIDERPFPADWRVKPDTPHWRVRERRDGTLYDVAAGFARNRVMLDERPELVIAFQVNGSSGTQDTIDEARRRGIPVEVHRG